MSEKRDKFASQLEQLIRQGDLLHNAMLYECYRDEVKKQARDKLGNEEAEKCLNSFPDFKSEYQCWYSEAKALVKQLLPDRLSDFVSHYEYPRARKEITSGNYTIREYLKGLFVTQRGKTLADPSTAISEFVQQLNIVKAAESALDSALFEIRAILQAELFDSEIDSAEALAKGGFLRGAGAICGVVIEKHLKEVCNEHGIRVRKTRPTISDLNEHLKKHEVVTIPQWRFVQHLADIRNYCDHHRDREPTKDEIEDLVSGTKKVMKTIF